VIASPLSLIAGMLLLAQTQAGAGSIRGVVVNASTGETPVAAAEVLLRVRIDSEFVAVASATTDPNGRFEFDGLPVDEGLVYLPGANRDGIHYPGPRLLLGADRPGAEVVLKVQDVIAEPSPLVIRDWDLVLDPEPGALRVTETLVIENPDSRTYVGRHRDGGTDPVTLQLGIPADFEHVTFDKEFYGRQFSLIDGRLATGIPWTPGRRELRFSYVLRNDGRRRVWSRPVDLPCRHVRLTVPGADPGRMSCNLGPATVGSGGAVFESDRVELPAGYVLQVELDRLPVSVMAYARWMTLAALAVAIAGSGLGLLRRRRPAHRDDSRRVLHRQPGKARARARA
jgi:hypothetical protein